MTERTASLAAELTANREYLVSVAAQISPDQVLNSTENPLWNVHDLLAHLAISERGLQATIKRFLAGEPLPDQFSLDYWNQRQVGKLQERNVAELLAGLQVSRQDTLAFLAGLTDDQLDVRGMHPAGFETNVAGVFSVMAKHEHAHGQEIAAAIGLDPGEPVDWAEIYK
ncbi:MAG: DinB family protein [Anaerolineae bacterium]|nr:DinB family protein [Anaerolineae bacterium]